MTRIRRNEGREGPPRPAHGRARPGYGRARPGYGRARPGYGRLDQDMAGTPLICPPRRSRPRQTQSLEGQGCFYIFTDACFERENSTWPCGIGAAIFDSSGKALQAFSYCLTTDQMNALGASLKHTIIFEAELLALVVAFVLWRNIVSKAPVVFYIDNNGARDVAISANGRSKIAASLVEQLLLVENIAACYCWFARVPSPSNPADDPSRNERQSLINLGASFVDVCDIVNDCINQLKVFLLG